MLRNFVIVIAVLAGIAALSGWQAAEKYNQRRLADKAAKMAEKAPEDTITIIEGWTLEDIGNYLQRKNLVSKEIFYKKLAEVDRKKYPLLDGLPENTSLEGYLFPDTYRIPKLASSTEQSMEELAEIVIEKMLNNSSIKIKPELKEQALARGLSVHQAVTLASIIEKETGRNATSTESKASLQEERLVVSGIFHNRLKLGMPLQSDATINFITKKNIPSASLQDLSIDSPYNTYKYRGLPPGPIGNPSLSSLLAAANPAQTDYYYFLHKQPSGEPVFSKTFEEHVQSKIKYLK